MRQRRVLVALDLDDAGEAAAALDDRPPSAELPQPHDLLLQDDAEARGDGVAHPLDSVATSRAVAPPSLTTKFACTVETRAAPHEAPFSPASVHERAGREGHALRAA